MDKKEQKQKQAFNYGVYGNYYGYVNKITLKEQQKSIKKYSLSINK